MEKRKRVLSLLNLLALFAAIGLVVYQVFRFQDLSTDDSLVTDLQSVDPSDNLDLTEMISETESSSLTEDEIDGLLLMREEEKLAHDVYTKLYEKWGQNIFKNISDSEQTHTDTVKDLLTKYDIEDPVKDSAVGVFVDESLLDLYTTLVEQGSVNLTEALTVGALVEDLDIKDLEDLMSETEKDDILLTYENLQKGSRNHMRSFVRVLQRNGSNYTPTYISQELYNEIIASPSENTAITELNES